MRSAILKSLLTFTVIVGCAFAICAQGKKQQTRPDLSGTWQLDYTQSDIKTGPPEAITIAHHEPEIKIVRTVVSKGQPEQREFTYYTDGRGEENPTTVWLSTSPDPNSPHPAVTKSRTRWSGDKIAIRSTIQLGTGGYLMQEDIVEEWKPSADGKTLTQTSRIIIQPGPPGSITVPAKQPAHKRVYSLVSK